MRKQTVFASTLLRIGVARTRRVDFEEYQLFMYQVLTKAESVRPLAKQQQHQLPSAALPAAAANGASTHKLIDNQPGTLIAFEPLVFPRALHPAMYGWRCLYNSDREWDEGGWHSTTPTCMR